MPFGRQGKPGLLGTVARTAVISGTVHVTTGAVNRRMSGGLSTAPPGPAPAPSTQVPTPTSPGPIVAPGGGDQLADQLARLADLHSTGVLTAEEFAAAKSRLLT